MQAEAPELRRTPRGRGQQRVVPQLTRLQGGEQFLAAARQTFTRWVRITMRNTSAKWHPRHLHGHHFQVRTPSGRGPVKDTVAVPARGEARSYWWILTQLGKDFPQDAAPMAEISTRRNS